jgi:ribosomal protein S6
MELSDDVTRVEAVSSVLTKFEDTLKVRYDIIKNLIVKEKIVLL